MNSVIFEVTGANIITLVALLGAIGALVAYLKKGVHWFDGVDKVKTDVETLKKDTQESINKLTEKHDEDVKSIKEEQTLIVYGLLACLKGLAEQGCDGPVHDAIDRLEKHLNVKAHE